jgi:hypothetical protein
MEYIPTTDQFVCVLNRKVEVGRLLNAIGHMAVGLGASSQDSLHAMRFRNYIDKDGGSHGSISDSPFIVLKADNSNKIRDLRNKLIEKGVNFTDFTSAMTVGTYAEQHDVMNQSSEIDLEYYGICFFMNREEARELTRKFSLFN